MTAESTFAHNAGKDARILMRGALWASLATFDRQTGFPYVSLIAVSTDVSGAPLFLISTLARHTQNLEFDARAAILFSAAAGSSGSGPDPLNAGRVSVMGRAGMTPCALARARFLARHPETLEYAMFTDFALWRLNPEVGHYVGGFGRIHTVPGEELRLDGEDVVAWAAQGEQVDALNARPDLIERVATLRLGGVAGPWRICGIDPEGCDFLLDRDTLRLDFNKRINNLGDVQVFLEQMADGK
jgi:putative heme iron utilization protein